MKYIYTDGNNNTYILKGDQLSYSPITKETSSTGYYDGGSPFSKPLEKSQLIRLIDVFERAIWSTQDQTDIRTMGSSRLSKPELEVQILLRYNSDSANNISNVLKEVSKDEIK